MNKTAKPNYLPKSLHTVSVLVNLARHIMGSMVMSPSSAVEQACSVLNLDGKSDFYGLQQAAFKVLVAERRAAKELEQAAKPTKEQIRKAYKKIRAATSISAQTGMSPIATATVSCGSKGDGSANTSSSMAS